MFVIAQAAEAVKDSGTAAIITAIGGVFISICSIWFNSRKSNSNTDSIVILAEQIAALREENVSLKRDIASLRAELRHYQS